MREPPIFGNEDMQTSLAPLRSEHPLKYKTVVCAIGPGSRERTLELISAASMLVAADGNLHVVHVVTGLVSSSVSPDQWAVGVIGNVESTLLDELRSTDIPASLHVLAGNPSEVVIALIQEVRADIVVIVAHRDDVLEHVFGSVLDRVVQQAQCSIYILRTIA